MQKDCSEEKRQTMKELQEIFMHYLLFLEEEAQDGNSMKELRALRNEMTEKGLLNTITEPIIIGKKRRNPESIHALETQL